MQNQQQLRQHQQQKQQQLVASAQAASAIADMLRFWVWDFLVLGLNCMLSCALEPFTVLLSRLVRLKRVEVGQGWDTRAMRLRVTG